MLEKKGSYAHTKVLALARMAVHSEQYLERAEYWR